MRLSLAGALGSELVLPGGDVASVLEPTEDLRRREAKERRKRQGLIALTFKAERMDP